jgi:hypothetical protein
MRQDNPLRPYSERARQARLQAAAGTTRPQTRPASPLQASASSRSYYPGLRVSQHPNANAAQVRRPSTGVGMGLMGAGGRPGTPGRGGAIAGAAGRGR